MKSPQRLYMILGFIFIALAIVLLVVTIAMRMYSLATFVTILAALGVIFCGTSAALYSRKAKGQ